MPKFRIRPGFVFIKNNKGYPNIKIVSDDDPAFKGQRHKFEAKPVDDELVAQLAKRGLDDEIASLVKPGATREAMVAKFTSLNNGVAPVKGATKSALREVFMAMQEGLPFAEASAELLPQPAGAKTE